VQDRDSIQSYSVHAKLQVRAIGLPRWAAEFPEDRSQYGLDDIPGRLDCRTMYRRAMVALTACAEQRLTSDVVAWLTTTRPDGSPATRPVWFVWREPDLLVYSEPRTHKVLHLTRDPRGNVHFNSDDEGGSVVVLDVEAAVEPDAPKPSACSGYLAKYGDWIDRLGVTVDAYDRQFSTLLRLVVRRCIDTRDMLGSD